METLVYSRREDFYRLGKALIQSVSIVLGSQLIVKGRAKILQSVGFLTQPYVLWIYACVRVRLITAERLLLAG